jgi:hypothetical protein
MTEQEIRDNNHKIALFMGASYEKWESSERLGDDNENDAWYYYFDGSFEGCSIDELQYHLYWDWLMPVVVKINEQNHNYRIEISRKVLIFIGVYEVYEYLSTLQGIYQAVCKTIDLIQNENLAEQYYKGWINMTHDQHLRIKAIIEENDKAKI